MRSARESSRHDACGRLEAAGDRPPGNGKPRRLDLQCLPPGLGQGVIASLPSAFSVRLTNNDQPLIERPLEQAVQRPR